MRNEELGIRNEELGIGNEELGMRNYSSMRTNSVLTPCKVRYFHVTPLALGTKFPLKPGRAATDETVGRSRPKLAS